MVEGDNPMEGDAPAGGVAGADIDSAPGNELRKLEYILDIPLEVTVELGHGRMSIQELLQLGQGSVVELTKLAGEPLDILVNDRLIARGEAVVVGEKFGVRVTDIVSPSERVAGLRT